VLGVLFFDSQCICLSVCQLHTPIGKTVLFSARFTTEHQLETPWKSNPLMSVAIRPQEMAETFIATGTILSCSRVVFHFLLNQPSKVSFWSGSLKRADLGWGTNWKQCTTTISCITQVRHFEGLSRNGFKLPKSSWNTYLAASAHCGGPGSMRVYCSIGLRINAILARARVTTCRGSRVVYAGGVLC